MSWDTLIIKPPSDVAVEVGDIDEAVHTRVACHVAKTHRVCQGNERVEVLSALRTGSPQQRVVAVGVREWFA